MAWVCQQNRTGPINPKYRIHPIYFIRRFSDVGSGRFPLPEERGCRSRSESVKRILSMSWVMGDLIIQDFVEVSSNNLVRVLSEEKTKMFGIQKLHAEEIAANDLLSASVGGSSAEDGKARSAGRSSKRK
jgi:hypothetical protein